MAELALKVADGSNYEDGDILCAFNARRIACTHMQHICHKGHAPRNGDGLILPNSLTQAMLERTRQYRFERLDHRTVNRIVIATGEAERFSHTPNAKGEQIDVPLFVKRRLALGKLPLFGEPGREVWYGGRTDYTQAAVDDVWAQIEQRTPNRKADFDLWPAGVQDLKEFFFIAVDDFEDETAEELVRPLERDTGGKDKFNAPIMEQVKKRKHNVSWRDLPGISAKTRDDILDKGKTIDGRRKGSFVRRDIVVSKTLPAVKL